MIKSESQEVESVASVGLMEGWASPLAKYVVTRYGASKPEIVFSDCRRTAATGFADTRRGSTQAPQQLQRTEHGVPTRRVKSWVFPSHSRKPERRPRAVAEGTGIWKPSA